MSICLDFKIGFELLLKWFCPNFEMYFKSGGGNKLLLTLLPFLNWQLLKFYGDHFHCNSQMLQYFVLQIHPLQEVTNSISNANVSSYIEPNTYLICDESDS